MFEPLLFGGLLQQQIFTNSEGQRLGLGGGQTSAQSRAYYLVSECHERVIH